MIPFVSDALFLTKYTTQCFKNNACWSLCQRLGWSLFNEYLLIFFIAYFVTVFEITNTYHRKNHQLIFSLILPSFCLLLLYSHLYCLLSKHTEDTLNCFIHTQTHTHRRTHTDAHTHTHAHTQTHTHTQAWTSARTVTLSLPLSVDQNHATLVAEGVSKSKHCGLS